MKLSGASLGIGAWTALVLAALLAIAGAGCGGSSQSPSGTGGSGGTAGGTGGSGNPGCQIVIVPVVPTSFTNLHPGDRLRVRGQVTGPVAATATWSWSVVGPDGSAIAAEAPTADTALVDIPLAGNGTYAITARYGTGTMSCSGSVHLTVTPAGARTASFSFRVTPPPGSGWPAQQLPPVAVLGGTPSSDNVLKLEAGTAVTVRPAGDDGSTVAAYLRAVDPSSGLVVEGYVAPSSKGGETLLLPNALYDLLVIPDGIRPPLLLTAQRPTDLAARSFVVDQGLAVTGTVVDGSGRPLSGARISLRAGALPSTLGTADATGAFAVRVRPGTYGATVVPGAAMPGVELSVAAAPGIVVASAPVHLSVRMAALATARLALTVSDAGNGAKLLIEGREPVAAAGMVEMAVGGTIIMGAATMRIRTEVPVAPGGNVEVGPLPRMHYRVTVFAAGAAPAATVTTIDDLDATAGDVQRTMTMATPVTLSGTLRTGQGARVQAIDTDAPAAVAADTVAPFVTQADERGAFSLNVNPSRRYRVIVDPAAGAPFARAQLPSVAVATAPVTVGLQELPPALLFGGRVVGPHLEPAPGTLVTAFCVGAAPVCADPTRPIAETTAGSDGSFRLMLPDPGVDP